jgi:3D (Asp-Asp-Asp) domain-containing protein
LVEIGRFHTITIYDGSQQQTVRTAVHTVGEALQEAGILLFDADRVEPPSATPLKAGLIINIQHSRSYTIQVDGRQQQTRSYQTSATAVVAEAGILLNGEDYTIPGSDVSLRANDIIQVVRVSEDFRLEDEAIPYQTIWQASDQLDLDIQEVVTPGVPGILRRRLRVRYENGVEVNQTIDNEWVEREPANEVVGYGTRINVRSLDTADGPLSYWRVVRMRVTSYTASSSGRELDDPAYGITASGYGVARGMVAVDRSIVPFRSFVYVPNYGVGYVGDTGGGVLGRWIDLGYQEHDFVPWSGYTDVYYLTPVPAPEDINYLLPTALP